MEGVEDGLGGLAVEGGSCGDGIRIKGGKFGVLKELPEVLECVGGGGIDGKGGTNRSKRRVG